jgi:hypothetical protein
MIYCPAGRRRDLHRSTVPASVHINARCLIGATGASCIQCFISVIVALQPREVGGDHENLAREPWYLK